jgi:TolB-like protein/tetratricopeptide (TPR) repeat protein
MNEFLVGDWQVEPSLNRITKADTKVSLEPKAIEVLLCLAKSAGEVLSKKEIIKAVWAGTYVSDGVLSYCISELRKAFRDDAKNPQIIQTIPRKGYRLIAPVSEVQTTAKQRPSIAVLAFSDMSAEKDQDYFCDGIAEEILNDLAHVNGLNVAARTSSFAFKGKPEDIRVIGRKLGVDTVLEGSVRKAGSQLRITAQLVSTADGYHLWSESYDRKLKDLFAIQDEIAHSIVQSLEVELSDAEKRLLTRVPTRNVEAFDFYIRGRQFFYRTKRKNIEHALDMFRRATEKDSSYALAYAGMADCYSYLYMYFDNAKSNLELAQKMSRMAIDLDAELAEAHTARGLAVSLRKKHKEAENEFKTAIEMNPRLFEAYYFYARLCFSMGRLEEAAQLYEQAESFKPEDCQASSLLAFTCRVMGQMERSQAAARRTLAKAEKLLELNPDNSRVFYLAATALLELGEREKSIEYARKCCALDPEDSYIAYGLACFQCRVGNLDEAMDCFEQAVRAGFTHKEWIVNDTDLDPIRKKPRFKAVVRRFLTAD